MRILTTCLALLALAASAPGAKTYSEMTDDEILELAGLEFAASAKRLAPSCADQDGALQALGTHTDVRRAIVDSISAVRVLTEMKGIRLVDAIDDSLVHHLGTMLAVYREAKPEPIFHPGTEKFAEGMKTLGFVRQWATGFLVHLEMQQIALLLADFQANRSAAEIDAARDAYLRHIDLLCQLHRAQHEELNDLHNCNLANMDWSIGRLESENGTNDFVVTQQWFAQRQDGFAYTMKLVSPTTGESIEVDYPLPFMTLMDEGWQRKLQQEQAAGKVGEGS